MIYQQLTREVRRLWDKVFQMLAKTLVVKLKLHIKEKKKKNPMKSRPSPPDFLEVAL